MLNISPLALALIPVVVGLTAIAKGFVSTRWYAVTAVIIAIQVTLLAFASGLLAIANVGTAIIIGIVIGLSACGLYSGSATTFSTSVI